MKSKGFTLIEIVVFLTMIGILSVTVSLRPPEGSLKLEAQIAQVIQDIRYVQNLAMSRGERHRIIFGTNTYRMVDEKGSVIKNPTTGLQDQPLETGFTFSATTLRDRTLVFDSRGVPMQGSFPTPFLTDERVIVSSESGRGGCARGRSGLGVITITENTGYVYPS